MSGIEKIDPPASFCRMGTDSTFSSGDKVFWVCSAAAHSLTASGIDCTLPAKNCGDSLSPVAAEMAQLTRLYLGDCQSQMSFPNPRSQSHLDVP
jgi:hypothetical protein